MQVASVTACSKEPIRSSRPPKHEPAGKRTLSAVKPVDPLYLTAKHGGISNGQVNRLGIWPGGQERLACAISQPLTDAVLATPIGY